MKQSQFIHLRLHSEYSIVDGIVRIKPLMESVTNSDGMPAVALTDQMNLFGMVKFFRAALNAGIKPIIGADLLIDNKKDRSKPFHLIVLCQNQSGYQNLTRLISKAYLENQFNGVPLIDKAWLAPEKIEGLIALSGGRSGDIGHALLANHHQLAEELIADWQQCFPGRFYIELQRCGRPNEQAYIADAVKLAQKTHVPVVATNDVRFLEEQDFAAHEARVCIHEGWILNDTRRAKNYSEQQYLRTADEMQTLFADIPEALSNSVEIAKRCSLQLSLGQNFLPNFPVPENITVDDYFNQAAEKGLAKRLQQLEIEENNQDEYSARLTQELDVIKSMGFAGYFLIVADFIQWARDNKIPVGPGRGSGAGSLVAYALGITDLDPIGHELLFERFLNPERVSMPDFDIDFCMEGRDRVIDYVAQKYGRDSVSQIITYGSMAAKAVVRDVGRVFGHGYGFVDKIAKLIPFELGMTLKKALQQEDRLLERYQNEEEVKELINLAIKLEGIIRNAGKHAGGVVIAPSVLTDFTPLYCEEGGANLVTQFDKDDVESVGLVKFDFLGLRTLTIIDWAIQGIKDDIDITKIPMDDEKTFDLLKACLTTAVFQLESRGMKDLIKRLQPDNFNEIVALVALFRPGPLQSGMVDDFINRKHGRQKVEYPHPSLEPILQPTYGVILYQEQVMQIARVLSGYTLGSADILRRAMGKKKPEEMAKQRAVFVLGAENNNVDPRLANNIFDLIEKFAGYGFNKSHSAAYALIAYQTAWLKAHYPAEFMAAVLSSDMDNTDKVVRFVEDCKLVNLNVVPPNINQGEYKFTVNAQGDIIFGLGAVKGVGEGAVENIVTQRREKGAFSDLFEFCQRVETRKVNRKVLDALIRSGAMDDFNVHRASLIATVDIALQAADQHQKNQDSGQHDLFGQDPADDEIKQQVKYKPTAEWTDTELLTGERDTLGFYLSGHPIEAFQTELAGFTSVKIAELNSCQGKTVVTAGFVAGVRTMFTKRGNKMAFVSLEDQTGRIDLAVFSETYEQNRDLLVKDQLVIVVGEVSTDDYTGGVKMSADKLLSMDTARQQYAKRLVIEFNGNTEQDMVATLTNILQPHLGGECPVSIIYQNKEAKAELVLGKDWSIAPNQSLLAELQKLCGQDNVRLQY